MDTSNYLRAQLAKSRYGTLAAAAKAAGLHVNTLGNIYNHGAGVKEQTAGKLISAGLGTAAGWRRAMKAHRSSRTPEFEAYAAKVTIRARSRRRYELQPCERCNTRSGVERHHDKYDSEIVNFMCRKCHAASHHETGTWGHGGRKQTKCCICCTVFVYKQKKASKVCSAKCLSARLRQVALMRWQKERA